MARNNVMIGVAAGAALAGVAYLMSKKSRLTLSSVIEEAEHLISKIRSRIGDDQSDDHSFGGAHDGRHLAEKVRHRVERNLSSARR